jgi:hypothetical protein
VRVLDEKAVEEFFRDARERQAIYLRRRAGKPAPWTDDAVMQRYRITNVYREQDKTTKWFRENVRDKFDGTPEVLLATVVFRWFNTIRTGETLFMQPSLLSNRTPFEEYLDTGDIDRLRAPLIKQGPPWVTGAYMIRSPTGMDKLNGILKCIDDYHKARRTDHGFTGKHTALEVAQHLAENRGTVTLKQTWEWLQDFYGQGKFLSYEVVEDLSHTYLLNKAPDIMTWMNPGPGALRGAALLLGRIERDAKGRLEKSTYAEAHDVMAQLLDRSMNNKYWPQEGPGTHGLGGIIYHEGYQEQIADVVEKWRPGDWPTWTMHEPEMWACEYVKITRTRLGFGRPRGTFP